MKKSMILLFLICGQSVASIGSDSLYQYIYNRHYFEHFDEKMVGSWETKVKLRESFNILRFSENELYIPLMVMQTLEKMNKDKQFTNYITLKNSFDQLVDNFLADNEVTGREFGSINFWRPYPNPKNNSEMHYYPKDPRSLNPVELWVMNKRNIPNDFDDSLQLCEWMMLTNHEKAEGFCKNFVRLLSLEKHQDISKTTQSIFDSNWKKPGSGAYGTWTASESAELPYNANDIDCVINMNILATFNTIEKAYGPESIHAVKDSAQKACELVTKSVIDKKLHVCSPYYDKTHALWAFSKVYASGKYRECLEPARESAEFQLMESARSLIKQIFQKRVFRNGKGRRVSRGKKKAIGYIDSMDAIETLLAMYELKLPKSSKYGVEAKDLAAKIYTYLTNSIVSLRGGANYVPTGFVFRGVMHLDKYNVRYPITGQWYSSVLTTALMLQVQELYPEFMSGISTRKVNN